MEISGGVSQENVLGPIWYLFYTRDIQQDKDTTATFVDNTTIMAAAETVNVAMHNYTWTKK